VFLQARSQFTLERNRLVAIFLRKMEFFDGVFFLTTNLVNDFDAAILNRIHLRMKYEDLDKCARSAIIGQSLEKIGKGGGPSNISAEYLERFACVSLNGREVCSSMRARMPLVTVCRSGIRSPRRTTWPRGEGNLCPSRTSLRLWQQMAMPSLSRVGCRRTLAYTNEPPSYSIQ
jgi:hypothetical protein